MMVMVLCAGSLPPGWAEMGAITAHAAKVCSRTGVAAGGGGLWSDGKKVQPGGVAEPDIDPDNPASQLGYDALAYGASKFTGSDVLGKARWVLPGRNYEVVGDEHTVVFHRPEGIAAYEAKDGRVLWHLADTDEEFAFPWGQDEIIAIQGKVLVRRYDPDPSAPGRTNYALQALDPRTGDLLWCAADTTDPRVDPAVPGIVVAPVVTRDQPSGGVEERQVALIDAATGQRRKTIDLDTTVLGDVGADERTGRWSNYDFNIAVQNGKIIAYAHTAVAVYDLGTGELLFDTDLDEELDHDPEGQIENVAAAEGTVMVQTHYRHPKDRYRKANLFVGYGPDGRKIWQERPDDGEIDPGLEWKVQAYHRLHGRGNRIPVTGGVVLMHNYGDLDDFRLRAVRVRDGKMLWERDHSAFTSKPDTSNDEGQFGFDHEIRGAGLLDTSDGSVTPLGIKGTYLDEELPHSGGFPADQVNVVALPGAVVVTSPGDGDERSWGSAVFAPVR
ncbi:PQQ-binding-like beta-propeller repeat protein [Nocardiopsis rhodophaea]|uniref:outer membrane protein assembly factor BamB family protein n=1 Tax=Nocardiopsis rhodophaea TaxID=280238 RepID=UPI0031DA0AA4